MKIFALHLGETFLGPKDLHMYLCVCVCLCVTLYVRYTKFLVPEFQHQVADSINANMFDGIQLYTVSEHAVHSTVRMHAMYTCYQKLVSKGCKKERF